MPGPERTCLACRKKGGKGELIRVALAPSGVVLDYNERLPGRGAYVCPVKDCIESAITGKTLSKAFKRHVAAPDAEQFYAEVAVKAATKATSLVGMSKKSGHAVAGFDAVVGAAKKWSGGLIILASDISDGTRRKLMEALPQGGVTVLEFSTKDGLGTMLGEQPTAVVYIDDQGLAAALSREIGRLDNINRG